MVSHSQIVQYFVNSFKSLSENENLRGMGTTMVVTFAYDKKMYVCNVGDSRVYLFKKPFMWQLTEDHSLVNEQIRSGIIPEDRGFSYPAFPRVYGVRDRSGDLALSRGTCREGCRSSNSP